jgi:flagellar export protein FliJ
MAGFTFRLQTLLRLRESERQRRRADLAQAHEAGGLLQVQRDALQAECLAAQEQYRRSASPGELNVDQLLELRRYTTRLQAEARQLQQRQQEIGEEIERRRALLVEADRRVRTLEKLRDKQQEAFIAEQQKAEQKVHDELAARASTPGESHRVQA